MRKKLLILAVIIASALAGVVATLYATVDEKPDFHDFIVMSVGDYTALVDGNDVAVKEKIKGFRNFEDAYLYVRDVIRYIPSAPAAKPRETMRAGAGSCLGKAALLASLYRAMGADPEEVRVVVGIVGLPGGVLTEHVWVDVEQKGVCLQQDATDLLGRFAYDEFKGAGFVDQYVVRELYCFNDEDFGVISQMSRMGRK